MIKKTKVSKVLVILCRNGVTHEIKIENYDLRCNMSTARLGYFKLITNKTDKRVGKILIGERDITKILKIGHST